MEFSFVQTLLSNTVLKLSPTAEPGVFFFFPSHLPAPLWCQLPSHSTPKPCALTTTDSQNMQSVAFTQNPWLFKKNSLLWHLYTLPPSSHSPCFHTSLFWCWCAVRDTCRTSLLFLPSFLPSLHSFIRQQGSHPRVSRKHRARVESKVRQIIERTRKATPLLSEATLHWPRDGQTVVLSMRQLQIQEPCGFVRKKKRLDGRGKRNPRPSGLWWPVQCIKTSDFVSDSDWSQLLWTLNIHLSCSPSRCCL